MYIELPGDEQDHDGGVAQTKSQVIVHSRHYHRVNKVIYPYYGESGRAQGLAGSLPSHCRITFANAKHLFHEVLLQSRRAPCSLPGCPGETSCHPGTEVDPGQGSPQMEQEWKTDEVINGTLVMVMDHKITLHKK